MWLRPHTLIKSTLLLTVPLSLPKRAPEQAWVGEPRTVPTKCNCPYLCHFLSARLSRPGWGSRETVPTKCNCPYLCHFLSARLSRAGWGSRGSVTTKCNCVYLCPLLSAPGQGWVKGVQAATSWLRLCCWLAAGEGRPQ